MTKVLAAALLGALQSAPAVAAPGDGLTHHAADAPVRAMLDAIAERDSAALEQSLAQSIEPEIIYYWGEIVSGREAIVQWHREWFTEGGWRIEPGPVDHRLIGERLASVAAPIRYIKTPERQFVILINYVLLKEADGWKIARVQQTLVEGPD